MFPLPKLGFTKTFPFPFNITILAFAPVLVVGIATNFVEVDTASTSRTVSLPRGIAPWMYMGL